MLVLRDKSLEIKTGLRKSFQDENSKVANRICYGYSKLSDGTLTVNEAEAEVVRFIFSRYNQGDSLGIIAKKLEVMGIMSPTGKAKWNREAISKLLSNEKYVGKVMLQKTHNFCGIQFENDGLLPKVLLDNHHPVIISMEQFNHTQELKAERAKPPKEEITMQSTF